MTNDRIGKLIFEVTKQHKSLEQLRAELSTFGYNLPEWLNYNWANEIEWQTADEPEKFAIKKLIDLALRVNKFSDELYDASRRCIDLTAMLETEDARDILGKVYNKMSVYEYIESINDYASFDDFFEDFYEYLKDDSDENETKKAMAFFKRKGF